MKTQKINHLAVWLLVVMYQVIGAGWYGTFAQQWMALTGLKESDFADPDPTPYIIAIVTAIIVNYGLAVLFIKLQVQLLVQGLKTAAFIWFAFQFADVATTNAFSLKSFELTLVDTGKTFVCFVVSGALLGAWIKFKKA